MYFSELTVFLIFIFRLFLTPSPPFLLSPTCMSTSTPFQMTVVIITIITIRSVRKKKKKIKLFLSFLLLSKTAHSNPLPSKQAVLNIAIVFDQRKIPR